MDECFSYSVLFHFDVTIKRKLPVQESRCPNVFIERQFGYFKAWQSSPNKSKFGSGGGSVGRMVPSDTREPQFASHHWQNFIYQLYNQNTKKDKK